MTILKRFNDDEESVQVVDFFNFYNIFVEDSLCYDNLTSVEKFTLAKKKRKQNENFKNHFTTCKSDDKQNINVHFKLFLSTFTLEVRFFFVSVTTCKSH